MITSPSCAFPRERLELLAGILLAAAPCCFVLGQACFSCDPVLGSLLNIWEYPLPATFLFCSMHVIIGMNKASKIYMLRVYSAFPDISHVKRVHDNP